MVGGAPAIVGAIGTCGDVGDVAAAGCVALVPECETPTTLQALKATSASALAAKLKTTRPRRELKVLFNAPYFRRPAALRSSEARIIFPMSGRQKHRESG
jgi:hypothetical protein